MKSVSMLLLGTILMQILVCGCVSYFPEPKSETDTLLIIKADREKQTDHEFFGNYTLVIYNLAAEPVKRVTMNQNSTYFLVQGLPPGRYYVGKVYFTYENNKRGSTSKMHHQFWVTPGAVTILRRRFVTRIYDDDTIAGKYRMNVRWEPLEKEHLEEMAVTLRQNENLGKWREIHY